jgi:hypothetical protein
MAANSNNPSLSLLSNNGKLSFEVISFDIDPSENKWFYLKAIVESDGFAGWSRFWLAPCSLKSFLRSLEEFDRTMEGNPKLVCGFDGQELFCLEFIRLDHLGNIVAKIGLVALDINRTGTCHKVGVEMGIDFQAVSDFRKNLETLVHFHYPVP